MSELRTAEPARADAARRYAAVEDTRDGDLEAIARLAARIAGVDRAAINLVNDEGQRSVAATGFGGQTTSSAETMCRTAIGLGGSVYLTDARDDARFADKPMVRAGDVRFYNASPLRSPDGFVVGTLCVFGGEPHVLDGHQRRALDDLADQVVGWLELRRRHNDLASAVGELERSNADLAEFAGRMAHDLRNPLTALQGYLMLADRRFGAEMSERLRSIVVAAAEAAERMGRLIDDMLAFASLGTEPAFAAVDLAGLVAEVVTDCGARLAEARADVVLGVLPTVVTDASSLRMLLANLIGNSAKFTRVGVTPRIEISAGLLDGGPSWWIAVADNGRGVPPGERGAIFEPFTRGSNSDGAQGSGIGLATCARAAERIGGELAVTDTPGGGATFTLRVPTAPRS